MEVIYEAERLQIKQAVTHLENMDLSTHFELADPSPLPKTYSRLDGRNCVDNSPASTISVCNCTSNCECPEVSFMPNQKRQSNNPSDRVAPPGTHGDEIWANLANARYKGSSLHKSRPGGGYDLVPPVNARHNKSLCDDLRMVRLQEAARLFRNGIQREMVSNELENGLPKRVWAVDHAGEAYVAYLGTDGPNRYYHGFRLYRDERQRKNIIVEWRNREPAE